METKGYEFTEQENLVITKLFRQMTYVGVLMLILGVIFGVFGVYLLIAKGYSIKVLFLLVLAFIIIVMGVITNLSANRFRHVVKTEGDDIGHLIQALDKLTTWFSIQNIIILVFIGIIILGFIAYLTI
ncbi:MAG: hypothetical protein GX437_06230 [Sphingobacteriales bacterium]|nr:hypothetical protein [Sphingobacteriales bacterium]